MKRSTLALALCIGLCACSGQKNKDTSRGLGSGDRDAAADADQVEPSEDGEVPEEEDASEPTEDGGDSESDAGAASDGGSNDAGSTDAGSTDAGGADASVSDAGDAGMGDAGGNDGTKLRVKLPFYGVPNGIPIPGFRPSVVFSLADGGVESVREVDDAGIVVSDTAPAAVTAMLYSGGGNLDDVTQMVTVLAPALGDTIEISAPLRRPAEEPQSDVYLVSASGTPANSYAIDLYAGVNGCARGYLGLVPAPTAPARVGKYSICELENQGAMFAVARDIDDGLRGYAAITLPATSSFPASVSIDQWLTPETLTLALTGTQPNTTPRARVWLRKGRLRLAVDTPEPSTPNEISFDVARSIVDSFDLAVMLDRTQDGGGNSLTYPQTHLFQKNRPANVPSLGVDMAERLPGAANLSAQLQPITQPSGTWTLEGGPNTADAVLAVFSWYYVGGDSVSRIYWYVIGPPDTLSVKVPAMPTTGFFGPEIDPNPDQMRFEAVEYYDSDQQSGYRGFLTEPLRSHEAESSNDAALNFGLIRSLPVGATLRASSTFVPGT